MVNISWGNGLLPGGRHQAIIRTNIVFTINGSYGIHLRVIFQEILRKKYSNVFENYTQISRTSPRHQCTISSVNSLRPRQNGRHFPDDILKGILLNENVWISIKISLKFVPKDPINYNPALVQIMAWHRTGDKPLSELMMVRLPTHICVTRTQWVKQDPNL